MACEVETGILKPLRRTSISSASAAAAAWLLAVSVMAASAPQAAAGGGGAPWPNAAEMSRPLDTWQWTWNRVWKEVQNYMNQAWLLCCTSSTEKGQSYDETQKDAPYYKLSWPLLSPALSKWSKSSFLNPPLPTTTLSKPFSQASWGRLHVLVDVQRRSLSTLLLVCQRWGNGQPVAAHVS
jgi:hypothetical protein